jgi:hypothetical protein
LFHPQENLTMKKTLSSLAVAAIAVFGVQATMAQTAASPTREEVKQQAAAANKAGSNVPDAAMGAQSPKEKAATSTVNRDQRKASTAAANKAGAIPDTSVGGTPGDAAGSQSPKEKAATSTTTRDDRKAATAAANQAGTIPQTEAQMQAPKK